MGILTIRLPEETHEKLRDLARHRHVSLERLMEELSISTISELDAQMRFRARAALGSPDKASQVLDGLDGEG